MASGILSALQILGRGLRLGLSNTFPGDAGPPKLQLQPQIFESQPNLDNPQSQAKDQLC